MASSTRADSLGRASICEDGDRATGGIHGQACPFRKLRRLRRRCGRGRRRGGPRAGDAPAGHPSRSRHDLAVARTLRLAEESAAAGDYRDALAWLGTLEAIGETLPATYRARRAAWTAALLQSVDAGSSTEHSGRKRRRAAMAGAHGSARQLHCDRCGLIVNADTPWLQPRFCPRCLAYARTAVKLSPRTPPSESPQPQARQTGRRTPRPPRPLEPPLPSQPADSATVARA